MTYESTIGLDIGDKWTHACVIRQAEAAVVGTTKFRTTPAATSQFFAGRKRARVVLEAGTHAGWLGRAVEGHGHELVLANPRKLRMRGAVNKNDKVDAEFLARMGRADPELLYPVIPRAERVQIALGVVRARDQLVRTRTAQINHVRAVAKTLGHRLPAAPGRSFPRLREAVDEQLMSTVAPLFDTIEAINDNIKVFDREIDRLCIHEFPETSLLRQVPGVGALTALTYVLVIGDPHRFPNGRSVGAFVGLVPRRAQSGGRDPQLGIHKCGDSQLRKYLVQCANWIMGPFGPEQMPLR